MDSLSIQVCFDLCNTVRILGKLDQHLAVGLTSDVLRIGTQNIDEGSAFQRQAGDYRFEGRLSVEGNSQNTFSQTLDLKKLKYFMSHCRMNSVRDKVISK